MLNVNKNKVQESAEEIATETKNGINKASQELKSSANKASHAVANAADHTEDKTDALINGLRDLINQHADPLDHSMKEKMIEKVTEIKSVVGEELSHAYHVGKEKAAESVQNHPVGTIALVAGAGLLLGYVLGSKQSSH